MEWWCYAIIILLVVFWITHSEQQTMVSECTSNGLCYDVFPEDSKEAAQMLNEVNNLYIAFMRKLREKYLRNEHPDAYRTRMTEILFEHYNPDKLREHEPRNIGETAFVIGKGSDVAFCLRSGDVFQDSNTLAFVALHEMSHMTNYTRGNDHDAEFWREFKILLTEAKEFGLYEPQDYARSPVNYCGLHINYNPYFDPYINIDRRHLAAVSGLDGAGLAM
jgi:hypothetical protein